MARGISFGRRIFLATPLLLGVLVSFYTCVNIIVASSSVAAASFLETKDKVSTDALMKLSADIRHTDGCRPTETHASVTVALAVANSQNVALHYSSWSQSVARAEAAIKHALSCSPADSNLWLKLAMARFAAGEDSQEQAALLSMSKETEPNEASMLQARLSYWAKLSSQTLKEGEQSANSDVFLALGYIRPSSLKFLATSDNSDWKQLVAANISLLPEVKQRELPFYDCLMRTKCDI